MRQPAPSTACSLSESASPRRRWGSAVFRFSRVLAVFTALQAAPAAAGAGSALCPGDCDGDKMVSGEELLDGIHLMFGAPPASGCSLADFDHDHNSRLTAADLVAALAAAIDECGTALPPRCGNGVVEAGEPCDDGNSIDNDGCRSDCELDCATFPSTYALLQRAVFEKRGCTSSGVCHGAEASGALDLRDGVSYDNLVGVQSFSSELDRVKPGNAEVSNLWLRLAKATLTRSDVSGAAMPLGLPPLSADELEALRLWIHDGAPRSGVIPGTANLLNACLPEPQPIELPLPDAPAAGAGVQLSMGTLVAQPRREHEYTFASYYDFRDQVPAQFRGQDGTTFRYHHYVTATQSSNHHLIIRPYKGTFAPTAPAWGPYSCRGGANDDLACDPFDPESCGAHSACTTALVSGSQGRVPPDFLNRPTFGIAGTQQRPLQEETFAPGVYSELPLQGMLVWNVHFVNPLDLPGKMNAVVNLYFAPPPHQQFPVQEIFVADALFAMNVPPCELQELCRPYVVPDGARVFALSSHNHKRGKRFLMFRGSYVCRGGANAGASCSPHSRELCGAGQCEEESGGRADSPPLYASFIYNDPVYLEFDPPLVFSGTPAQRTLTYCALYDNGYSNPADVKRKSTSPPIPEPGVPGGPCAVPTHCVAGKVCAPCTGATEDQRNTSCDSTEGAGDGLCDACPLLGGVTAEDEMFGFHGRYYFPEPAPDAAGN